MEGIIKTCFSDVVLIQLCYGYCSHVGFRWCELFGVDIIYHMPVLLLVAECWNNTALRKAAFIWLQCETPWIYHALTFTVHDFVCVYCVLECNWQELWPPLRFSSQTVECWTPTLTMNLRGATSDYRISARRVSTPLRQRNQVGWLLALISVLTFPLNHSEIYCSCCMVSDV